MRTITDHIVEGDLPQNQLTIEVTDEPGADGASHYYEISGFSPSRPVECPIKVFIPFQNGSIAEVGVNGITHEALLGIIIDRLRSFQEGPFACLQNQHALNHCQAALHYLKIRTEIRLARGVEGQAKP